MKLVRLLLLALACAAAEAGAAAELGRLFLTPAERAALERLRHAPPASVAAAPAAAPAQAPPVDVPLTVPPLTVNGYIMRSAGAPTVWINGADAMREDLSRLGIDARRVELDAARVRVPLAASDDEVTLKPGQSFDPASRQVSDAYERQPSP